MPVNMPLLMSDVFLYGLLTGGLLGLLGAGGSIIIWPLLVLVLGHPEKIALIESLIIVGGIAAGGVIPYVIKGQVDYRAILFMGISGALGASLGAWVGKEASDNMHRLFFVGIAWTAAWNMLRGSQSTIGSATTQRAIPETSKVYLLCGVGFLIGICSGFSSIGGGFLLVPALVLFCHLPMHHAIGTSLALIFLNTFSGFITLFLSDRASFDQLDYELIATYMSFGLFGSVMGGLYAQCIPQKHLRIGFGCMLLMVGGVLSYDLF